MAVIKQSLPKQYMSNLEDLLEHEDYSSFDEYEIYSECSKLLINNNLNEDKFLKLFDFFFFSFAYNEKDCSGDIKKLFKKFSIDSDELLVYTYRVTSFLVKNLGYEKYNTDSLKVVYTVTINSYKLFLMYCFDLIYGNKKIMFGGLNCKYKDLDDSFSMLIKNSKYFKSNFMGLMEIINPIPEHLKGIAKIKVDTDTVDIALFQKTKLKYEYLLIKYFVNNILKDEESFYVNKDTYAEHVIGSLTLELKDNEFCCELTPEFYNLLRKRAYLLPKNGISLNPDHINFTIDMYERQFNGDNYIIIITYIEGISYFTFINLNKQFTINNSPFLYDLCNFMYRLYKLDEYSEELYGKKFSDDPYMLLSFKTDSFITGGIHTIKGKSDSYKDFTVEVPYYWKYRDKKKSNKINKKLFLEDMREEGSFIYVSAFKRKLPNGYRASDEAKKLSEFYCLELEQNETLVSPFIRMS